MVDGGKVIGDCEGMNKTFVTLCRCSTENQGLDGHGMESQRQAVKEYVARQNGVVVGSFEEIVSGGKTEADRPALKAALDLCKKTNSTLVCKRLDRLGRNASNLLSLLDSGVEIVFVDQPGLCKLSLGFLSLIAAHERELISLRTMAGLKVARARGVRLGNPKGKAQVEVMNRARLQRSLEHKRKTMEVIAELKSTGVRTLAGISKCLNIRGHRTVRGGVWYPKTVRDVMVTEGLAA